MINLQKITLLVAVALIVSACSSAYKQGNWANNHERDWDLDSAVCMQKSEKLSKKEVREIKKLKQEKQDSSTTSAQVGTIASAGLDHVPGLGAASAAIQGVSAIYSMVLSSKAQTVEENYIEKKFSNCLEGKSWYNPDEK